jgi:predicted nucleotidyltransferase component of viral defense system
MKSFSSRSIQDLEILQLIILDVIFSLPVSRKLLFQGGTCLRWAYSGTRYSEDLDFLARDLETREINELRQTLGKGLEKKLIIQFGPGLMEVSGGGKGSGPLHVLWVKYRRQAERRKMAVKIEVQEADWSEAERFVLRQLPEVSRFLLEAAIRVPFGRSVIQCSSVREILAEKIKALVERPYLKGRDLYDIWFMRHTLQVSVPPDLVVERTKAYPGKFVPKRSLHTFLSSKTQKQVLAALEDLHRFIPPEELTIMRKEKFKNVLLAVEETVGQLLEKGLNEKIIE